MLLIFTSLFTAACSSAPTFQTEGVDIELMPQQVEQQNDLAKPLRVFWGGNIVKTTNLKTATHIEVLSLPLNRNGSPNPAKDPQGRFIIERNGFLDPAKYTSGRRITVVGTVLGIVNGKVGEAPYRFPVVKPEQLHLWPRQEQQQPNVHFGVGVGIYR